MRMRPAQQSPYPLLGRSAATHSYFHVAAELRIYGLTYPLFCGRTQVHTPLEAEGLWQEVHWRHLRKRRA